MENNVLQQILTKLESLEAGQAKLEAGQAKLEAGQAKLEAGQAKLEIGQSEMRQDISDLKAGQSRLERELGAVRHDLSEAEIKQQELQEEIVLVHKDVTQIYQKIALMHEDTTIARDAALRLESKYIDTIRTTHDVTLGHTEKLDKHDKKIAWLEDKVDRIDNVQIAHTLQLERLAQ